MFRPVEVATPPPAASRRALPPDSPLLWLPAACGAASRELLAKKKKPQFANLYEAISQSQLTITKLALDVSRASGRSVADLRSGQRGTVHVAAAYHAAAACHVALTYT